MIATAWLGLFFAFNTCLRNLPIDAQHLGYLFRRRLPAFAAALKRDKIHMRSVTYVNLYTISDADNELHIGCVCGQRRRRESEPVACCDKPGSWTMPRNVLTRSSLSPGLDCRETTLARLH
jgi:hypothetical protein